MATPLIHPTDPSPTVPQPRSGQVLANEISKTLRLAWASRAGMYFEIPLFVLAFFVVLLFIGRGTIPDPLVAPTLIGMTAAMLLNQQLTRTFWGTLGELQAGTFEQLHLSPTPSTLLMLARQGSTALQAISVAAIFSTLALIPSAIAWDLDISLDTSLARVAIPALAAIVGAAGLGLAVAGLTLLFRRLEVLVEVMFAAAFILGGVLIPLHQLSPPMAAIGRLLLPIAQPIAYARAILVNGHTLANAPIDWGLTWLLGQPLLFLALGLLTYHLAERTAQQRGSLGR